MRLRQAVEFCQRTSARGRGKAVLVYPAEDMNAIAANTLLKTLEEPAGSVRFVLATEAAHQLLPTIRSRCLAHTMVWPQPLAAQTWLESQGLSAADAQLALRAMGGSPQQALALARAPQGLQLAQDFAQWVRAGDMAALGSLAPPRAAGLVAEAVPRFDVPGPRRCAPLFFARPFAPAPRLAVLLRWSQALNQEMRVAEHPFQPALTVQALVVQARSVLHSKN